MPVDLSCIPARAKRQAAPSFKRWVMFLMVLIVAGAGITAYIWPTSVPTHTATFWFCFLGIPSVVGGVAFAFRWLIFLAGEWLADGWDAAREWDLAQDIRYGQRSLGMLGYVVHLPHVISSASISQQMQIPEGIILPTKVDETGELLIRHASFSDVGLPVLVRVKERINSLLTEAALQNAFQRIPQKSPLAVLFQFSPDISLSPEERGTIQQLVQNSIGFPFNITFISGEGLQAIDAWLDRPDVMQTLLVITLNLTEKTMDGTGEAAAALLMNSPETPEVNRNVVAQVHRPEQMKTTQEMSSALMQALHWGETTPEEIKHIWLTGTGASNKATALLSTAGVRFPVAGQPCDIDLKTGLTRNVSPWLAIAVAADRAGQSESSQLVMYVPDESILPWFMIVCPVAK
ncbi:TPA: hypothetical protein MX372_002206 [Enterobacter roggenkampii]|uniref:hypothetical protein n=1 Tax=Enterobacter roggenkampii TaxID=1812935 RepID=UPI0006153510|nr:hypothetical protein [Enterobacter roggenkampii]EKY3995817.1 hypothetical protein [Enterobacter roggenkampii]KKA58278.1 hypothetical protein UP01_01245 [Enterobacter roggenkampii]MCK6981223.1 hypothetical protein [Enterobacter roggenkampii]WJS49798.1 hypothetical protein QU521_16855 [Enterobacter roggenkampii]HCA7457457.1 hypothetical protein [Enterobacter roggenkampii]